MSIISRGFVDNTLITRGYGKTLFIVVDDDEHKGAGKPIGVYDLPWEKPKFEWDRSLIRTKHIKVPWTKKEILVDCIFISDEEIDEEKAKIWADYMGYSEIRIITKAETIK